MAGIVTGKLKSILLGNENKPVLGDKPFGGPLSSIYTFVVIVRQGYNVNIPNANSAIRLGFCRGFEQLGIKYRIISVYEIEKEIGNIDNPIIFLSAFDYLDMSKSSRKKLRNYKHFVWISPDYKYMKQVYARFNYPYSNALGEKIFRLVSYSEPSFIWAPAPPSALEHYSDWRKCGCRIESIPLACDTGRYFPSEETDFKLMNDIVFVGGYWPKKAIQFDKYLRPLENKLHVYGYSSWPYSGYKGGLKVDQERILYSTSKISPALSEPHAEFTGDIVERGFKIMGSRGLAVPDVNKYYNELFSKDELFIPASIAEYYDFINEAIEDEALNRKYRLNGYNAVINRHTYRNRAEQILNIMNIKL